MNLTQKADVGGRSGEADRVPVELVDVETVARVLGCSTRTVYRLADSGKMPRPVKLGQLVRWPRTELERWIADGCPAVRSCRRASR